MTTQRLQALAKINVSQHLRNEATWYRDMRRIAQAQILSVVLPRSIHLRSHKELVTRALENFNFNSIVVECDRKTPIHEFADTLRLFDKKNAQFHYIYNHSFSKEEQRRINRLSSLCEDRFRVVFRPQTIKELNFRQCFFHQAQEATVYVDLSAIKEGLTRYQTKKFKKRLSKWQKNHPWLNISPYPWRPLPIEALAQPLHPCFEFATVAPRPRISVLVVTKNQKNNLVSFLHQVLRQDYNRDLFELLVLDNGSTDQSYWHIQTQFEKYQDRINLSYYYLPRSKESKCEHDNNLGAHLRYLNSKARADHVILSQLEALWPKALFEDLDRRILTQKETYLSNTLAKSEPRFLDTFHSVFFKATRSLERNVSTHPIYLSLPQAELSQVLNTSFEFTTWDSLQREILAEHSFIKPLSESAIALP